MIIRVFRARLKPGKRAAYERLCREISIPLMRAQPGFLTARIGEPQDGAPEDFVFVSIWRDLGSIQAFVGERWREVFVLPGEADLLESVAVEHFDESYHGLVALWRAVADIAKRREIAIATAPLTDPQWERIQPALPCAKTRGRPRADDRRTLDGILYVLRTGCRWHDLPATYGSPVTCWRRFRQWEADGTWERVWAALFAALAPRERQAWVLSFLERGRVPSWTDPRFTPPARRRGSGRPSATPVGVAR
jgi:transposase/quinol monooxygenase YgiN